MKALLISIISYPELYGDVINKRRKIIVLNQFQTLFVKRTRNFIKKGYTPLVLQRAACLVVSPFTVGNRASLFNFTTTGRI